jgi:cell division protein FtsW (lipid II flippase)
MITEKIFKNIILTQLALMVTVLAIVIANESGNSVEEDLSFSSTETISLIIGLGYCISLFMLYKFKPIGKKLFVSTFVLSILLLLFEPVDYSNYTPVISAIENLLYVVDGIILATLFFTSIKEKFD